MKYFAVIGVGSIGKRHLKNLKHLFPKDKTIAVASRPRKLTGLANADICLSHIHELNQYSLELIIIASPASFHAAHVQQILNTNAPVLIEKPVTSNKKEFDTLAKAISQHSVITGVAYCLRFLPSAIKLKAMLEQNAFGKIYNVQACVGDYLPNWRPEIDYQTSVSARKKLGGGVLLELSHELDYLQWFFGELNLQYSNLRQSNELSTDVEEIADLVFITTDDVLCNLHLDFVQKSAQRYCHIISSKGRVEWDLIANNIVLHDEQGRTELYSDQSWDKNLMYVHMVKSFYQLSKTTHLSHEKENSLAQLEESGVIVKLIDQIKIKSGWQ